MKDEQLNEAIRALREAFPGSSATAWRTELRIVEGLEGQQRRTLRFRWGLPLAAVCLGSTAWAANHPEVTSTLRSWFTPQPTKVVVTAPTSKNLPSLPSKPPTLEEVTAPVPAIEVSREAPLTSVVLPQAHSTSPIPPANGSTRTTEVTAPLLHYRAAQRLQFEEKDCVNAIKSWEAYLVVEPRGPLVLDARYHRAECLFQLGRSAEARTALKPFADGEYGSYRRDAARTLLEQP